MRVLVNYETLLSIGGNCALLRKVLRVRAKFSAGRAAILRGIKTSGGGEGREAGGGGERGEAPYNGPRNKSPARTQRDKAIP